MTRPSRPAHTPGPRGAGRPAAAAAPCPREPEYHLHLDADRDGRVDADRTGLEKWDWGAGQKGAIILFNNDDDDGGAVGKSDHTDRLVNGGNDSGEIGPLVIRRTGGSPPVRWRATLEVPVADRAHIRIFDGTSAGAQEIIGPTAGHRYVFPDLNFVEKVLGMEALMYADGTFSGEVKITFTLSKAGAPSAREVGAVRVAPWMMPNHLDAASKVFVVSQQDSSTSREEDSRNLRFRRDLNTLVTGAGCTLTAHRHEDVWMQDCMELGFANLPNTGYHVVMRAPRNTTLNDFARTLRTADFGYHEKGGAQQVSDYDATGNLECTPPVTVAGKRYPWGRMYYGGQPGSRMLPATVAFLEAQTVQAPFEIDTSFLAVGHVDEIMTFVPAPGPKGFKLLLASPDLAYKILKDSKDAHGGSSLLVERLIRGTPSAHRVEITIKAFLETGYATVPKATAAELDAFNKVIQAKITAVKGVLCRELALDDADILEVPVIFIEHHALRGMADALTADMVNMLVLNRHCIIPKPFGPVVDGKDLFEKDLEDKLTSLGLEGHFIDDWYEYHVSQGEVHCGTNTLRAPTSARWWEFVSGRAP